MAGVAPSTARYWERGRSSPTLLSFAAYARALNFVVILRASDGREIDASDARQVMGVLFASRVRAGASFLDMEARSGISAKSAYAWLNGRRQPALANLAAWAQSLGFDLIMRRAPESTTEKRSA